LKKLVRKAQAGDADSFIELMELNKENMYKIAKSYLRSDADVADAMQETTLKCFERIESLDNPKFFKTWLTRILINNCNDIIRKGKSVQLFSDYKDITLEEKAEDTRAFNELVQSLDEKYRTILVLYYVEGFKINEIAQILDVNVNTINSRLQRSRAMLKAELTSATI
jgi:RNA polymerase sigma factor, sigma-70 family